MTLFLKPPPEPWNSLFNLMPPKADPYATPVQRRIDALLTVITVITVAILLLTGSHGRAAEPTGASIRQAHSQTR